MGEGEVDDRGRREIWMKERDREGDWREKDRQEQEREKDR